MHMLLLVLACLAHHAHARRVSRSIDDQDSTRAIAGLLSAVNPSLSMTPSRPRGALRAGAGVAGDIPSQVGSAEDAADMTLQLDPAMDQAGGIDPAASGTTAVRRKSSSSQQLKRPARKSISASDTVLVQGGSLKTWSYRSTLVDQVQVVLTTDGRPLDADIQLWQGPDNNPCKMRVYSEDGSNRPFNAVIETPGGGQNTVAVRNVGQIEFPLAAEVIANAVDEPEADFRDTSIIVQGGALRTFNFDNSVESVEIMLKTDGRPLNARIEMLQGPNNNKQVIELYTEDGLERPFFAIIDTLGSGNVVRVVNTAPMEFPMTASVQPHRMIKNISPLDPVIN